MTCLHNELAAGSFRAKMSKHKQVELLEGGA